MTRRERARGRDLHDTERYERLCSTCMTLLTAKRKRCEGWGKAKDEVRREKWAETRVVGSPPGVPTKGFSAASIPIGSPTTGISLIPFHFGGIHHPRRRTCPPFCAPEFHPRPPPFLTPSPNSPQKFFIRTLASFTSKVFLFFIEVLLKWSASLNKALLRISIICSAYSEIRKAIFMECFLFDVWTFLFPIMFINCLSHISFGFRLFFRWLSIQQCILWNIQI